MTMVEAWYTPQIPVSHGPLEYWGLPGLILEVSAGNTTMLCSKITLNPEQKIKIEAPSKGKEITKKEYKKTIISKMQEFRDNRVGRRRS
jgi:GLPGLI family protein